MITANKNLAAAATQDTPLLRVSTRFMETLQKVQPVIGGNDITTFFNTDRLIDLYTSGTDHLVFRLRPQGEQYAPYQATGLGIKAAQLSPFVPLKGSADNPSILGIDNDGKLTLSTYTATGYQQQVFEPAQADKKVKLFQTVTGATGNIYVTAILEDNSLVNNYFSPGELKWQSSRWVPINDPNNAPAQVQDIATVANNPASNALFAIGLGSFAGKVLFAQDNYAFTSMVNLNAPFVGGKWGTVSHISAILDNNKLLNVFAVESTTGTLWQKKQKKYSTSGKIEFEDWVSVNANNVFGIKMNTVKAMIRFDKLIELYCIGEDGALYYTHQVLNGKSTPSGWDLLFALGQQFNNTNFTVTCNSLGYSEVYSITSTNEIIRFIQSPETTQWFTNKLLVEKTTDEVVSVATHSVDCTVLDENAVPQPNVEVGISTSYQTSLSVNGQSYFVSAANLITVKTDNTGRLSILQNTTSLSAATLYLTTPFTGTNNPIQVEPNMELQQKISLTTADAVFNAKDRDGNYLLSGDDRTQENAESIAAIMQSAGSLCNPDYAQPVTYFYHRRGSYSGFQRSHGLNIAGNAGNNWEIDFATGFPVYKKLTADAAMQYRSVMGEDSFLGIDWSDVWSAIKGGFKAVLDGIKRIVVTITDKISVVFEIVVNGVTKMFEAILDTVQQVFDFVEGVWNWLQVTAERVYQWLGFFFNWDDIKRTSKAIEYSTNVFLDFSKAAVEQIRAGAEKWFDGIEDEIKAAVDAYLAKFGDATTLGNFGSEYEKPQPEAENAMDHNPLFGAYKDNYGETSVKVAFSGRMDESKMKDLIDKLLALTEEFTDGDGKQAFDEAIGYFSAITDNPDQALQLLFSGLVKVGESIALFAVEAGKVVVLFILDIVAAIIDVFREFINEEWEIPIVSDIYKYITGDTLSFRPISLLSYMVGIPATLVYKLLKGEAPFKDDQALKDFEDYFTVDWLKQRAGIGTALAAPRDNQQESVARSLFKAGYAVSMFVASFASITTAVASSTNVKLGPVSTVSTVCSVMSSVFTNPWILEVNPGKLCPNNQASASGGGFKLSYIGYALIPLKTAAVFTIKKIYPNMPDAAVIKLEEVSTTILGTLTTILEVVEFITGEDADPKVFARTLSAGIPGKMLRFLSIAELNEPTYYIPVGILSVLTFSGYTAAFIINFSIDEAVAAAKPKASLVA